MSIQVLTLHLHGISASDYLARIAWRAAARPGLLSVTRAPGADGASVEAVLEWDGPAPDVDAAASAAGLPVTTEVAAIHAHELQMHADVRMVGPRELVAA